MTQAIVMDTIELADTYTFIQEDGQSFEFNRTNAFRTTTVTNWTHPTRATGEWTDAPPDNWPTRDYWCSPRPVYTPDKSRRIGTVIQTTTFHFTWNGKPMSFMLERKVLRQLEQKATVEPEKIKWGEITEVEE